MIRRPERERLMPRERRGESPVRARPLPEFEPVYKKGGSVKESKAMAKKEIAFMKKKGAPKSMIKHEKAEYGMKKMAGGGMLPVERYEPRSSMGMRDAITGGRRMAGGGKVGGSFRKAADGVASKGKTKGKMVKMAYGGKC
jgi:hypothetical protein